MGRKIRRKREEKWKENKVTRNRREIKENEKA